MRPTRSKTWFTRFAKATARIAGRPVAFSLAVAIVILWLVSGPVFGFSDTWQLVINTGTTIITFLMVFLIQSTQNRDSEAIQVKLDELIRLSKGGHNALLDLEEMEEEELDRIHAAYRKIAEEARSKIDRGLGDTDVPEVAEVAKEVDEVKHEVAKEAKAIARVEHRVEEKGKQLDKLKARR